MSSDAYGVPQRKYDYGRDIGLAGQALTLGGQYRMQDHLAWARTDALTCAAGENPYLPFEVPPLPIGSLIRATVHVSTSGASDAPYIAFSPDAFLSAPSITDLVLGNAATTGLQVMAVFIRDRNTSIGGKTPGTGTTTAVTIDWMRTNRLLVGGRETTGLVIAAAFVEVFIPRVYR